MSEVRAKLRKHSDAALARLAVSAMAADVADRAEGLVVPETSAAAVKCSLEKLAGMAAEVEELTRGLVVAARELGMSWVLIGEALGVTKQAVQGRFAGDAEKWRDSLFTGHVRGDLEDPEATIQRLDRRSSGAVSIADTLPAATDLTRTSEILWRIERLERHRELGQPVPEGAEEDLTERKKALAEE